MHGFVSKPEIQKLNRNSIYVFVNGRLIRDRLIQHAITEAYRNILPPTVFPVVLLFLDLPSGEVDVNVHPSKTEVRFRQQSVMHDFVRDSIRAALMKARPVPQFAVEISAHPSASPSLLPVARLLPPMARRAWRPAYSTRQHRNRSFASARPAADQRTISVRRGLLGRRQRGLVPGSRARTCQHPRTTVVLRRSMKCQTERKGPAISLRRWPR